jgi:hypothetical protein
MVADEGELEPGLLGQRGIADEVGRAMLFAAERIANPKHGDSASWAGLMGLTARFRMVGASGRVNLLRRL